MVNKSESIEVPFKEAVQKGLRLLYQTKDCEDISNSSKIIVEPRAPQLLEIDCNNYINKECERAYSDASSTTHFQQYVLFIFVCLRYQKYLVKTFVIVNKLLDCYMLILCRGSIFLISINR
jgi:hypothetical protein